MLVKFEFTITTTNYMMTLSIIV